MPKWSNDCIAISIAHTGRSANFPTKRVGFCDWLVCPHCGTPSLRLRVHAGSYWCWKCIPLSNRNTAYYGHTDKLKAAYLRFAEESLRIVPRIRKLTILAERIRELESARYREAKK